MDENLKGRCLGLIGGLGVGATVHYYQELAKAREAEGQTLHLVMAHADMQIVFRYVGAGELGSLAQYLAELVSRLRDAGAEIAAVGAVMPHLCVRELIALSPLPLVNLLESTSEDICARRLRRLALFGTRFTIGAGLFRYLKDVEFVTPKADEVDYIHDTYVQLASQGSGSTEHRRGLAALAHRLLERERLDAIVLAGTDLSLLFNESNTDFPHVDCARLHIHSILRSLRH